VRHALRIEELRTAYILPGEPEGKRPLDIPRLIWEDNIKLNSKEVGCESGLNCLRMRPNSGLGDYQLLRSSN
jgi:hypothetical protein